MCAIFGICGKNNESLLKNISKSQIYRGPDSQNFFIDQSKKLSLGNNRLAVVDREGGNQPMWSSDKKFLIVFNGCIFNFREIKTYLKSKKIVFKTSSDTEVFVNAYMYFGDKCFNYFDGMWASAIYDVEKNSLILSRDYLGQKPLYYHLNKKYFLFSSQINGILEDKDLVLSKDKLGIAKYFLHGFFPAPWTPYKEIKQLEPGAYLKIDLENFKIEKNIYWDIVLGPDFNSFFNKEDENFSISDTLKKTIKNYSIADKKLALALSGGIDSYLISKYFSDQIEKTSSFTLGFEDKSYDETKIVDKLKLNLDKKIFKKKNFDLKRTFVSLLDKKFDPLGDSSLIPTYILFEHIKEFSNVALTGDGGDENFFGYIIFDGYKLATILKKFTPNFIFNFFKLIIQPLKISNEYMSNSKKVKTFFDGVAGKNYEILPKWISSLRIDEIEEILKIKINKETFFNEFKKIYLNSKDDMRFAQLYMFKFYLPNILCKIDQASMLNSVESRSPFLSKNIINYSLNKKSNDSYRFFKKKFLILENFKSIIPNFLLKAKKHGFAFRKELILKDVKLIKKLINENELINKDFFNKRYEKFLKNSGNYSNYLWYEIMLNNFFQKNKR